MSDIVVTRKVIAHRTIQERLDTGVPNPNLLINGDAETGIDGWVTQTGAHIASDPQVPIDGLAALHVYGTLTPGTWAGVLQTFDVNPNRMLDVSLDVRLRSVRQVYVDVAFYKDIFTLLDVLPVMPKTNQGDMLGPVLHFETKGMTPPGATQATFTIHLGWNPTGARADAWFDNMALHVDPTMSVSRKVFRQRQVVETYPITDEVTSIRIPYRHNSVVRLPVSRI